MRSTGFRGDHPLVGEAGRARRALLRTALAGSVFFAAADARGADLGDDGELAAMRAKSPRAAELFLEGESLAEKGSLAEAIALFRQGEAAYPDGSLLWRRDCEIRTALGQRREAVIACAEARERGHAEIVERALVSAFVDGPTPPTSADLYQAWLVTDRARKNPLGQVTLAATTCNLAERIGDGIMLQECEGLLERIAPDDPATRRASAALRAFGPRPVFWLGWSAVLAAVLLTLVDAVRRVRRGTQPAAAALRVFLPLLPLLSLLSLLGTSATARAEGKPLPGQSLSKWPLNLEHPEDAIPSEADRNADPLQFGYWIQDVAATAERKSKEGDHLTAAKLYTALGAAVPDRAIGFVKACEEYEAMGEIAHAANACGQAILRDGVRVVDYSRFVHLMVAKPGPLGDKDVLALNNVLSHMKDDPVGRAAVPDLQCEIGAKLSSVALLRECTRALEVRAPEDAKTITYEWALAVAEGKFDEAKTLAVRAKAAGVSDDGVAAMARATTSTQTQHRWTIFSVSAAAALFALGIAFLARKLFQRQGDLASPTHG